MQELKFFRLIAYLYTVIGMSILAWGMSSIRHSLARGFTAILMAVAVNNSILFIMLVYSMIDRSLDDVTFNAILALNSAFMAIVTTMLLAIFRRMYRTG